MKPSAPALALLALTALVGCNEVSPTTLPASAISAPLLLAPSVTESQVICSGPETQMIDPVTGFRVTPYVWPGRPYGNDGIFGTTIAMGGETSKWIGPSDSELIPAGIFTFFSAFVLPPDVKNVSLDGLVHADNRAKIYLNGSNDEFFDSPLDPYPPFSDPADPFSVSRGFIPGFSNTLTFDLTNHAPSKSVLDFCYTVTYSVPSDDPTGPPPGGDDDGKCLPATSVATAYLKELGEQPNSRLGKNLISQVTDAMGPRGTFAGLDKCDEGYRAAVESFLDDRL